MEVLTKSLTLRLYEEKDINGILRLWEEESNWGGINLVQFKKWFTNTPYGDCIIVIAADDNDEVVGQIVFTPTLMHVSGKEVKALRVAAPILSKNFRFSGSDFQDQPLYKMFNYGVSAAVRNHFTLLYIFPAKGWLRAIKAISNSHILWQTSTFNGFSIPLDAAAIAYTGKCEEMNFTLSSGFTDEYDELWNDAVNLIPIDCGIVRKKEWLTYRLAEQLTIEARDKATGKLQGYCTLKKSSGLLIDMLARNKRDLACILIGTIAMLHHSNPHLIVAGFNKITGMKTQLIDSISPDIKVGSLDYTFDFGCCILDDNIHPDNVRPESWYMMPDV